MSNQSDPIPDGYHVEREIPIDVIAGLRDSPANMDDPDSLSLREITQRIAPLDYIAEDADDEERERRILEDFKRRNPMNPYQEHLNRHSDIREHLGLLYGLAKNCGQVVELGFRTGVAASAFLAAGAKLHSIDIDKCRAHVQHLARINPDTFVFKVADSKTCTIPDCDLLFIDTDHTEATTLAELELHEQLVSTWIVLHDTVSFGRKDRPPGKGKGVMTAIDTFLSMPGDNWMQWLHLPNNNGLTLLKRR